MLPTVCSRSQGQSRRRRFVSSCSSASASAKLTLGRGCGGGRRRRVAGLVVDLLRVLLLRVVDPLRPLVALALLQELLADRRLDVLERRRLRRLHVGESLDDVPAVLRLDRPRDLSLVDEERGLVERTCGLTLHDRELAALRARARILRVLLRQRSEVRSCLDLVVELVR